MRNTVCMCGVFIIMVDGEERDVKCVCCGVFQVEGGSCGCYSAVSEAALWWLCLW